VRNSISITVPPQVILLFKTGAETYYMNNTVQGFPTLYNRLRCYTFYRRKKIHVHFVFLAVFSNHIAIQTFHAYSFSKGQQIENAKKLYWHKKYIFSNQHSNSFTAPGMCDTFGYLLQLEEEGVIRWQRFRVSRGLVVGVFCSVLFFF